jgi:hypothetical protein
VSGRVRSPALASSATAAATVVARSAAEMPVVTPHLASMETVNPVSNGLVLFCTIKGRLSSAHFSAVNDRQMRPRPYLAMKLMASGVTISAAMVRSPSFSRSSSSTRITILPLRISSMAWSMEIVGMVDLSPAVLLCPSTNGIFRPRPASRSVEILDVALLRLRFQPYCGLGLNQNIPFVDGHWVSLKTRKKYWVKVSKEPRGFHGSNLNQGVHIR